MPMKRSSESSASDGVFLIHSLTKTLCSSPEETDLKKRTHFHQEDDSGIKSGTEAAILNQLRNKAVGSSNHYAEVLLSIIFLFIFILSSVYVSPAWLHSKTQIIFPPCGQTCSGKKQIKKVHVDHMVVLWWHTLLSFPACVCEWGWWGHKQRVIWLKTNAEDSEHNK